MVTIKQENYLNGGKGLTGLRAAKATLSKATRVPTSKK
jgi:hypothetical protein